MEQYLWMSIGAVIVGLFVKTYWDVYTAYRAFIAAMPAVRAAELPNAAPDRPQDRRPLARSGQSFPARLADVATIALIR